MIKIIRAFIGTYESYFWLGLCAFCFFLGSYATTTIAKADKVDELQSALDAQHAADKEQFEHDLKVARSQQVIELMNQKLNDDTDETIIKTPQPNCILDPSRVQLLNRAAARN